jgi:hypothetical protein
VEGLFYHLHHPMNCGCQARVQRGGGGARPPGLEIHFGVDHSSPQWTRSSMENHAFIGASLSNVRVIMVIMRILMLELICQTVTRWVPVLEFLLSGMRAL